MGVRGIDGFLLAGAVEVLHADADREIVAECVVDVSVRELFEEGTEGVDVPVVVEEVTAGEFGTPFWGDGILIGVTVGDVDTGAGGEELLKVCLLFGVDEGYFVLRAEVGDGGVVEVIWKALDLGSMENVEDAFADGGDVGDEGGVALFEDDLAFVDGHHGGSGFGLEPGAEDFEAGGGEACDFRGDVLPGTGDDLAVAHVDGD